MTPQAVRVYCVHGAPRVPDRTQLGPAFLVSRVLLLPCLSSGCPTPALPECRPGRQLRGDIVVGLFPVPRPQTTVPARFLCLSACAWPPLRGARTYPPAKTKTWPSSAMYVRQTRSPAQDYGLRLRGALQHQHAHSISKNTFQRIHASCPPRPVPSRRTHVYNSRAEAACVRAWAMGACNAHARTLGEGGLLCCYSAY